MARKKRDEDEPLVETPPRPVTLDGFVGHARQVTLLGRALSRGLLNPALLFSGPPSVGKGTLAWRLAAALECLSPTPWACGRCTACHKTARGNHPDIRIITLETNEDTGKLRKEILLDQVRDRVLAPLALPPYEGRKLVFIIEPAEAVRPGAQNALLKSLEEPPAYGQFILVASNTAGLLPTVRSRCQHVTFGPVPSAQMRKAAAAAGVKATESEPALACAAGAPGLLFSGAWREALSRREALTLLLEHGLETSRYPELRAPFESLAQEPPQALLAESLRVVAEAQRALVLGVGSPALGRAAQARGTEGLQRVADRLGEAPAHLVRNVNARLLLERIFLVP